MNGPSEFDRSEEVRGTEATENLNMMKLLADMMKTMENNRISTERMVLEVIKTKNDTEKFHIMPDLSKSIENYDGEIEKGPTAAKVWLEKLMSSATLHSWPPEFILESAKTHLIDAAKSWYNSNIPKLNTWENFKDRFEKTFVWKLVSLISGTEWKKTTEKKIEGGKGVLSKAERTCYKCGDKGHYKSECKNKDVKVNKIQKQEVVKQDLESEMLEGDVKNVKVKEVASKIENLYRPVMVNGVSLNGMVHNGSSMCIIKQSVVRHEKWPIRLDEVKLYGYGCGGNPVK
ncbi:hypothetical protein ILUMI_17252, partial [Ignelater luminosus]